MLGKTIHGVGKSVAIKRIAEKIERIDSTKIDSDGTFFFRFGSKSEGWYELTFPKDKSIPLAVAHGTVSIEADLSDSLTDEEFLKRTIIKAPSSVTAFLEVRQKLSDFGHKERETAFRGTTNQKELQVAQFELYDYLLDTIYNPQGAVSASF